MGTLIAGIHDTPYKIATRDYDLFKDGAADNRSILGGAGLHDARLSNVVAYISPAFSGVTLAIATSAGSEVPTVNSTKGDAWSFAALYAEGPFTANFAYQEIKIGSTGTGTLAAGGFAAPKNLIDGVAYTVGLNDETTAWKLGGGYTYDAFNINAVYEKLTYKVGGNIDILDQSNWYLSGKYNVTASEIIKAAYAKAGSQAGLAGVVPTSANGAHQFTIGYDHKLSKQSTLYALYSKLTNDSNADYTFNQGTSSGNANGGVGSDPSVFSLGLRHSF